MRSKSIVSKLIKNPGIKSSVQSLQNHHKETYLHTIRVAELSVDLGIENCLPDSAIRILGQAGLLHDLGKSRVEYAILSKNGPLTSGEYEKIKQHVRLGFIAISYDELDLAKKVFIAHHEFKRQAYPRGGEERRKSIRYPMVNRRIQNEAVLQLAQILAAADIFDALAFRRVYKEPFDRLKIQEIIEKDFTGNRVLINQLIARYPLHMLGSTSNASPRNYK